MSRRVFGASWWGRAWVEALEQRARLDPNRLPRGRTYARSGAVGPLTLGPGEIVAEVWGSRSDPYAVRVRVRPFDVDEWDRVLDALAAEIGHTAALLDGELPPGVADDVRSVGLDLLPGAGEVQPRCSCPDWADPCKHAAAVCYLVADALDLDPFGVLLLRGLGRDEVLARLRSRRYVDGSPAPSVPTVPSGEPEADDGIPARSAWSTEPGPLPVVPAAPLRAGRSTVLATEPPAELGVSIGALQALAADAVDRALSLAHGTDFSGLELTADEDLARRAAALLAGADGGSTGATLAELAHRAGLSGRELVRRAVAFRHGGREGLALLHEAWDPGAASVARGLDLLGPGAIVRRNRVMLGDRQVRLGHDGRWYPFRKDRAGRWNPDGEPLTLAPDQGDLGELPDDGDAD